MLLLITMEAIKKAFKRLFGTEYISYKELMRRNQTRDKLKEDFGFY